MGLTEKQRRALAYLGKGGRFLYNRTNIWWIKSGPFDRRIMAALHKKHLLTVYSTGINSDKHEIWSFGLSQLGKETIGIGPEGSNKIAGAIGQTYSPEGLYEKVQSTLRRLEYTESLTKEELLALKIARRAIGKIGPLSFRVAVQDAKEEL